MSEDPSTYCTMAPSCECAAPKRKRDIFRFKGERDMAINLEHVTNMYREDNRITFQFSTVASYVDLEDEESAAKVYEKLFSVWSS